MTGLYTAVLNNKIINCGYMGSTVCGIYIDSNAVGSYDDPRGGYIISYNTVRNAGRSAFSLQTYEPWVQVGKQPVYLPCEISYNQFVNGSITALDTGVVYLWGATMGNENRKTRFHNNAVYMEVSTMQELNSMIYHDNYMNMMQTYDNIIFSSNSNVSYYIPVYIQKQSLFPESYAVIEDKNNINYGYVEGGLSQIAAENYPNKIYFHTGIKERKK